MIVMLLILATLQGPLIVKDDLTPTKGVYATKAACEADKLKQSGVAVDLLKQHNAKAIMLDIVCYDPADLTAQAE